MGNNYVQGIYDVKNKDKYIGTKLPRYMSSWELDVFQKLDSRKNVLRWGSEIIVIPYWSAPDQKFRRYMVDIYVEFLRNGVKTIELIEIKPKSQLMKPKNTKRKKQYTYLKEVYTYNVNICKWEAAKKYAAERGWGFKVLTEEQLYR